jgi:TIR domain
MASPPKIFLSYASEDVTFVNWFTRKEWFAQQIGIVTLENYLAGDNLEFGALTEWVDKQISEATVVIAFVSEFYRSKGWTKVEWDKTLTEFRRRRLIFVPVMLDSEARAWWEDLRQRGDLNILLSDYMYSNFSDDRGKRLSISENHAVQEQIAQLARAIKAFLFAAPPVSQPPGSPETTLLPEADAREIVVLGHPTSRFAEDLAGQASDLVQTVRAEGLSVQHWKDGWLKNSAARDEGGQSPGVSAVFVQPLAAGEASEEVAEPGKTRKRLADAGVAAPPLVLWLPRGQSDLDFEKAAAASTETLPDLPTLRTRPALRTDPARDLSLQLRAILRSTPARDAPVVQIETVGSKAGQPDHEATRLSEQLIQLFGNIVNSVVTTDSTSPWRFWDELFKMQITELPGNRAIVAVHDLDVTPSADKTANRKCIELKFQRMQDYVRETDGANKLKFFWAALIYKNAKALPFAQYPFDGRFKDWRLLSFERVEGHSDTEHPVRPAPASLGAFRAQLSSWATN